MKMEKVSLEESRELYLIDSLYLNWFLIWFILGILNIVGYDIVSYTQNTLISFLIWLAGLFIGFSVIYLFARFFDL